MYLFLFIYLFIYFYFFYLGEEDDPFCFWSEEEMKMSRWLELWQGSAVLTTMCVDSYRKATQLNTAESVLFFGGFFLPTFFGSCPVRYNPPPAALLNEKC